MQMDSRIILAGQPVNALAALDAGTQAAGRAGMVGQQGDLLSLYRQQGAGIANGDPNALNALASLDPMASLGVQESRLGMDATRQGMRINEEQLQLARAEGARAAEQHAATLSAQQLAQERAQIAQGLAAAIPALRAGDLDAVNQIFQAAGLPPAATPDDAAYVIAGFEGAMERFDAMQGVMGQEAEAGFRPATPEEAALYGAVAGQFGPDNRFYPNNPPDALSFSTTPDGGVNFSSGPNLTMPGVTPAQTGLGAGAANVTDPSQFAGAVIDIGTTPQGFATGLDDTGGLVQSEIPGSRAAQERAAEEEAARQRQQNAEMSGTTVIQDLNRALQLIPEMLDHPILGQPGVAGANARLGSAGIGGSVPNRIRQFTESALSNVGLDTLQRMREASPTGGALGQVPIQQQQRLEQVLGSLRLDQEIPDLVANLQRVNNIYMDIIYGTSAERASLVERGQMSRDENAQIEAAYFSLPFDRFGRPASGAPASGGAPAASGSQPQLSPEARRFLEGN